MKKAVIGMIAAVALLSNGLSVHAQANNGNGTPKSAQTQPKVSVPVLPKMTGPYQVGTVNFDWTDKSRKDLLTEDPNDYREIMVQAWYPIDSGAGKAKETYVPSPVKGIKSFAASLGMGEQFAEINKVDTQTYKEALLSKKQGKYPIVLFSHGMGDARWEYQSITRELASHGFIVFSIEHTHFSLGVEFKSGKFIPFNTKNNDTQAALDIKNSDDIVNNIWVKDLQFVIGQLDVLNKTENKLGFKNKLDLSKIAAVGHSVGGATAARALQLDPRVKAAINLDGSLFGMTDPSAKLSKPFAFIKTVPHEQELHGQLPQVPADVDMKAVEKLFNEFATRYEQAVQGDDAYDITISGTTKIDHLSFPDHPLLKPYYGDRSYFVSLPGAVNPNDFYQVTNNVILSFLDKYLNGKKNTMLELTIK